MIGQVAPDHLDMHWPAVAPLFERVSDKRLDAPTLDEVRANIEAKRWQLWLSLDGETVEAALCTGIVREVDGTHTLQFEHLGGRGLMWRAAIEPIMKWGRGQGCVRARIPRGRPGWRWAP